MRLQTVLLILALAAVAVFLIRLVRGSEWRGNQRRLNAPPPPAHSAYVPVPIITDGGATGPDQLGHGTDCPPSSIDASGSCGDGGGSN